MNSRQADDIDEVKPQAEAPADIYDDDDDGDDMSTMRTYLSKRFQPPGTLTYTGSYDTQKPVVTVFEYDASGCEERTLDDVRGITRLKESKKVCWLNIDGLSDVSLVEKVGVAFGIHPLILEDILHTSQRPKLEDCGNYIYVAVKMLGLESDDAISTEQVSLIIGKKLLISFQEKPGDVFEAVRARIRQGKGHVSKMGADYLAYSLIDAVVDNYFLILEALGEESELMEEQLVEEFDHSVMYKVHSIKRRLLSLRRSIWPLREVIGAMGRSESPIVVKKTHIYIRDLYDNTIQVMDMVESLRDMAGGLLDTHLSAASNRMNSVMKVLAIIATIFIPLTFVAGVYGMNFKYMPELEHPLAYPVVMSLMLLTAVLMLCFFKRKKWL
ncbi:MAG: magnesium/cobalt transporter CorA [Victivallales bacterium]|nr:magnesium/cobalt transporter CorA [Victivallales bacterium]